MNPDWAIDFRARMLAFESQRPPRKGEVSASLKLRVTSGCFHREHSPHAYERIDRHLASVPRSQRSEFAIIEHESGPELLVYLALVTAGVTLAKSVIDLVIAIIKARAEGVKQGDRPDYPVEVIVRRVYDGDKFTEETVLRIGHDDPVYGADIEARVNAALKKVTATDNAKNDKKQLKGTRHKRRAS